MKRSRAIKGKGPPMGYARRLETGESKSDLVLTRDRFIDFCETQTDMFVCLLPWFSRFYFKHWVRGRLSVLSLPQLEVCPKTHTRSMIRAAPCFSEPSRCCSYISDGVLFDLADEKSMPAKNDYMRLLPVPAAVRTYLARCGVTVFDLLAWTPDNTKSPSSSRGHVVCPFSSHDSIKPHSLCRFHPFVRWVVLSSVSTLTIFVFLDSDRCYELRVVPLHVDTRYPDTAPIIRTYVNNLRYDSPATTAVRIIRTLSGNSVTIWSTLAASRGLTDLPSISYCCTTRKGK